MGLLGAHVSTAGGVVKAFERGAAMECESLQIFVKSPNQWRAKPLAEADVAAFREQHAASGLPVVAHAAYLINLASPKEDVLAASLTGLADELDCCDALGLAGLVVHPGGHLGSGVEAGIESIARSIDAIMAAREQGSTTLLLENTAGQGTSLGATFEQLAWLLTRLQAPDRLGVCFDTAHAHAAGYDLRSPDAYHDTWQRFDATIGLQHLGCIHLNDSKRELGSRVDRHEQLGQGAIGVQAFRLLMNDARLRHVPMILETPKGEEMLEDVHNLALLRSLRED